MICSRCRKQVEDESLFCTECGNRLSPAKKQNQVIETIKNNKIIDKINSFIERLGNRNINKYLSIIAVISMISIRLFGFLFITVLITIINLFLIYYNFKLNSKLDIKMIAFSLMVFFVGLLIMI